MKYSSAVLAALAASSAIAIPLPVEHGHNLHKREAEAEPAVVTVFVTSVVVTHVTQIKTVGAAAATTSAAEVAATTTAEPTTEVVSIAEQQKDVETSTSAAEATTSSPVEASTSAATSTSEAASTSTSEAASTSTSSSSSSSGSFKYKGISYSPYASDGNCKTADEVATDLAKLHDYEIIRLYNIDCSGVENVVANLVDGQKLFQGIYTLSTVEADLKSLYSILSSSWDLIDTIAIGNELVNSGSATVAEVKAAVTIARTVLSGLGYSGSIVSVDTFSAVLANEELCDVSDYIAINAHAYFDSTCEASNAGEWLLSTIESVSSFCGGKTTFVTESGWPSQGNSNGVAVPSTSNQEAAISGIVDKCSDSVLLFTAFNDLWKADGSYGVEKYWGILN